MAVYIDQKQRATYAGIWDKNKRYNPYSIVTTDNGYFLSASPVPAGIDITNDSYWIWYAGSGDSSALEARVTSLESRVDILSSTLNIIGTNVDNLSARTTNTENNVTILASALQTAGADIRALQNRVSAVENDIDDIGDMIDADRIRLTDLESRVTTNENNITMLASTFNIVGSDIDAINRDAINFTRMITGIN